MTTRVDHDDVPAEARDELQRWAQRRDRRRLHPAARAVLVTALWLASPWIVTALLLLFLPVAAVLVLASGLICVLVSARDLANLLDRFIKGDNRS